MLLKSIVALGLLQLVAAQSVSKDARCGRDFGGQTCKGSRWGNCCSQYGYCGSTGDYCDVAKKCQSGFGTCNGQSPANPTTMKTTTGSPPSSCTAATVTKDPGTITKPGVTVTSGGTTTTVTKDPVTITKDGSTITKPGVGTTTTVTIPGEGITITVPVTQTQDASTVTLPAETVTLPAITQTLPAVTLPAITLPVVTETLPAVTLPAVTETLPAVTETLPAVTKTLPAVTETLPAVTETLPAVTETLPATTETLPATTVTLPAETVTATATQTAGASCPTGDPIINGGFESTLAGSWVSLTAGDANLDRVVATGASGTAFLRSRIAATNPNLPQRVVQAVSVCPGTNYKVGFSARRTTTAGVVSAVLYVNDTPLAGGAISATAFNSVPTIGSGIFSSGKNTVLVRIEFTYSGGSGSAKEVLVDDITMTPA